MRKKEIFDGGVGLLLLLELVILVLLVRLKYFGKVGFVFLVEFILVISVC